VEQLHIDFLTLSVLLSVLFTLITVPIEIIFLSQARFAACLNGRVGLYAVIQGLGNAVATILASVAITNNLPDPIVWWTPLFCAFFGVFAFEGIMSNTNLTIFDKGVLTIQDWINKARGPAVALAVKKSAQIERNNVTQYAHALRDVPLSELNAYLAQIAPAELEKIEHDAERSGSDVHFYKALELVTRDPSLVESILKVKRQKRNNRTR
jgi:hypothetical protein